MFNRIKTALNDSGQAHTKVSLNSI